MATVLEIVWCKDIQAEETMSQIGQEFTSQKIKMGAIDWKKSKENRARDIFLDDLHKDGIKQSMQDGCTFPMIVVRRVATGFVIAGGNHRGKAAFELLSEDTEIPVYVVVCNDAAFEVLSTALNSKNGKQLSQEEKIAKAIDFHQRLGHPLQEACDLAGVTLGTVRPRIKAKELCIKMGIDLTQGTMSKVRRIPMEHAKFDSVIKAYGRYFKAKKAPSIADVEAIVREVSGATSEADMVAKIDSYAIKPKRIVVSLDKPRFDLVKALKSFHTATSKAAKLNTSFASTGEEERKEVEALWTEIAKNMSSFR